MADSENTVSHLEEDEECKLKAKYPVLNRQGIGSLLLKKRLNRGHKYFDSGDYNMARAKILQQKTHVLPPQTEDAILHESTGETMATPESVPTVRKKSALSPAAERSAQNKSPTQLSNPSSEQGVSLLST